jgi:hypothetical protein
MSNLLAQAGRWALLLTLLFAPPLAGCRSVSQLSGFSTGPTAPQILAPTSTADQVIAAVNQNTARVQTYVTNNASISVPGFPNLPLLQGNIAYERPQRFRFQARALTGPEVDFGSNDERFWLWARRMTTPDGQSPLYTVRHDQYATSGVQNMMPVEPQWIIDALGLVTIDPSTAQPPMPRGENLEVRTIQYGPRGPLTRVLLIDPHGWVIQQSIVDAQGTLLASATAEQFRYNPQTQVSLPEVVTVRVPAAELALRINTGSVVVNGPTGDPAMLWQPPVMPNHPVVDLGAMPTGTAMSPPSQPAPQAHWNDRNQAAPRLAALTPQQPASVPSAYQLPAPALPAPQGAYQLPAGGVSLPPQ